MKKASENQNQLIGINIEDFDHGYWLSKCERPLKFVHMANRSSPTKAANKKVSISQDKSFT